MYIGDQSRNHLKHRIAYRSQIPVTSETRRPLLSWNIDRLINMSSLLEETLDDKGIDTMKYLFYSTRRFRYKFDTYIKGVLNTENDEDIDDDASECSVTD